MSRLLMIFENFADLVRQNAKLFIYAIALLSTVIVIGITENVYRLVHTGVVVKKWPTTTGVIEDTYLETRSAGGGRGNRKIARAKYRYIVNGKIFRSDRISYGVSFVSRKRAYRYLERYPIRQEVTVHYSPKKPSVAVLDTSSKPYVINIILFASTIGILYAFYRYLSMMSAGKNS